MKGWTRRFQVPFSYKILRLCEKSRTSLSSHGSVNRKAIWVEKGNSWWHGMEFKQWLHSVWSSGEGLVSWLSPGPAIIGHRGDKKRIANIDPDRIICLPDNLLNSWTADCPFSVSPHSLSLGVLYSWCEPRRCGRWPLRSTFGHL